MAEVRMPKMSDGMEEGTVIRWLKSVGEHVSKNETIAEIETDKANVEMTSYDEGILSQIVVEVGQTVAVGAILAYIGEKGSSAAAANGSHAAAAAAPAPLKNETPAPSVTAIPVKGEATPGSRVKASPLARKHAQAAGINLELIARTIHSIHLKVAIWLALTNIQFR